MKPMFKVKNFHLGAGEFIVDVIRPFGGRNFVRAAVGFCIITLNAFFTFWLIQKGLEGQIFYAVVWVLGLYIILYGTLFGHLNYLVVTPERIFDVHRESLFSETISALPFTDLSDIVLRREGALATLFNYGALTLHPRDGKFIFEIEMVRGPARVQNLLFEYRDRARVRHSLQEKEEVLKRLTKMLPEYSEAELTLLYQKVHSQLLRLAKPAGENSEKVV